MNKEKHVLIVDDDESIGEMLQTLLEFNNYKADVVNNPQEIDSKIAESDFDVILLDMRLSGVNGTDICSRLKKEKPRLKIPVIMMSALNDVAETCKAAGADGFISKPFEMEDLLAKIDSVLVAKSL